MEVTEGLPERGEPADLVVRDAVLRAEAPDHRRDLAQPVAWHPWKRVVLVVEVKAPVEPIHPPRRDDVHVAIDHVTVVFLWLLRACVS